MINDGLIAEFDHEMATTRRLLERLPEDEARLAWQPHEKSRSLGALATHIARLPTWGETILNGMSFDLADMPPTEEQTSRAALLAAFDATTKRTRGWMDRTDPEYLDRWTLKRGGQEMFSLPKVAAFRTFVLSHGIHHRGQLSVYLRLNDIPLPPIYGPSSDEG